MPRLYYALWPDRQMRAALNEAALALDIRDGRRVRPENLHLTLCFLGSVSDRDTARLLAHEFPPSLAACDCEIGTAGWWRESRVAWLGLLQPCAPLQALRDHIVAAVSALGLVVERSPFVPHVTVARAVSRAPRATGAVASVWHASEFALVASHSEAFAPRYERLRTWPLKGAASD